MRSNKQLVCPTCQHLLRREEMRVWWDMTHLCFPTCFSRLFCLKRGRGGGGKGKYSFPHKWHWRRKTRICTRARKEKCHERERKGSFSCPFFQFHPSIASTQNTREKGGIHTTKVAEYFATTLCWIGSGQLLQCGTRRAFVVYERLFFIPEFQAHDENQPNPWNPQSPPSLTVSCNIALFRSPVIISPSPRVPNERDKKSCDISNPPPPPPLLPISYRF